MTQNRQSITEVERRINLKKIINNIQKGVNFKCTSYEDLRDIFEIEFRPKEHILILDNLKMSFASYHNYITAICSIDGLCLKLNLKLENLVICNN